MRKCEIWPLLKTNFDMLGWIILILKWNSHKTFFKCKRWAYSALLVGIGLSYLTIQVKPGAQQSPLWLRPCICMSGTNKKVSLCSLICRAATAGKAPKAQALPGFCRIESGCSSGGKPLIWPPLQPPCLPKIGRGSPDLLCTYLLFLG